MIDLAAGHDFSVARTSVYKILQTKNILDILDFFSSLICNFADILFLTKIVKFMQCQKFYQGPEGRIESRYTHSNKDKSPAV